jgi:hypothetical protein
MQDALAHVREALAGLDRAIADAVEDAARETIHVDVSTPILVHEVVREVVGAAGDGTTGEDADGRGSPPVSYPA